MFIILSQLIVSIVGGLSLWCEISHKYRDCNLHVSVRYVLMIACIILAFGLKVFYASGLIVQFCVFIVTLVFARLVHKKVLLKQIKVKNYRLIKKYLGGLDAKNFIGK